MSEKTPGASEGRSVSPWWGIVAVGVAAVSFAVYPSPVRLPFVVVAFALGLWAVVAAVKARPRPDRRRASSVLAVVSLLAAVVLVATAIVGFVNERERPRLVSIEAAGADIMQVDYATSTSQRSETWGSGDRHSFHAWGNKTTVHVTAMIGHTDPITCTIYIDNEPVVMESSSTDEVTCTYVYPWL